VGRSQLSAGSSLQVLRRKTLVREAIDEPVEPIGTSPAEVANRLGNLEPAGCAGRALRAVGGLGGGSFENCASSARGSQLRDQFVSSPEVDRVCPGERPRLSGEALVGNDESGIAAIEALGGSYLLDCANPYLLLPAFRLNDRAAAAFGDDQVGSVVALSARVLDAITEPSKEGDEEALEGQPVHSVDLGDAGLLQALTLEQPGDELRRPDGGDESPERPELGQELEHANQRVCAVPQSHGLLIGVLRPALERPTKVVQTSPTRAQTRAKRRAARRRIVGGPSSFCGARVERPGQCFSGEAAATPPGELLYREHRLLSRLRKRRLAPTTSSGGTHQCPGTLFPWPAS
jgi:hypothetical protein